MPLRKITTVTTTTVRQPVPVRRVKPVRRVVTRVRKLVVRAATVKGAGLRRRRVVVVRGV